MFISYTANLNFVTNLRQTCILKCRKKKTFSNVFKFVGRRVFFGKALKLLLETNFKSSVDDTIIQSYFPFLLSFFFKVAGCPSWFSFLITWYFIIQETPKYCWKINIFAIYTFKYISLLCSPILNSISKHKTFSWDANQSKTRCQQQF